ATAGARAPMPYYPAVRLPLATSLAIIVPAVLLACGAATDDHQGPPKGTTPAASSAAPPFVVLGGDASPPPSRRIPCNADKSCESPGTACVASAGGRGYCAPGCNKEGYCTPDRVCRSATDTAGLSWKACLPLAADCDALLTPAFHIHPAWRSSLLGP